MATSLTGADQLHDCEENNVGCSWAGYVFVHMSLGQIDFPMVRIMISLSKLISPRAHKTMTNTWTDQDVNRLRLRRTSRILTAVCLGCSELNRCGTGVKLKQLHDGRCKPQVGDDFNRCFRCKDTLSGGCAIDNAGLSQRIEEQLVVCNKRAGPALPFILHRFNGLHSSCC